MRRRFVLATFLGLAAVLTATNATQAQSYFFGYYYPAEKRFHSDQQATEISYDSYGEPAFLQHLLPQSARRTSSAPATTSSASIQVLVPDEQARVWLENQATKSTGSNRVFVTPPINAGENLKYHIIVVWKKSGQDLAVERDVVVAAGQSVVVDLTEAATGLRMSRGVAAQQINR